MKKSPWQVPITIVLLFFGIMASLQFQAQNRFANDLTMERTENLIAMVRGLSEKRQKLALEIIDLKEQYNSQVTSSQDEKRLLSTIQSEMDKLNIITGKTSVKGPGLVITLDQHMPILYIDLIYIINELWAAGAEAIAINDYRITNFSSIYFAEEVYATHITVDNYQLEFPIQIKAIGNANNLEKGLTIPGGIIDNLALYKAFPELEKIESLTLPPIQNPNSFIFLQEYKAPPNQPTQAVPSNLSENEKQN